MKMPKRWKKVKKALNKAMRKEMDLPKKDKRDVLYFSFDSTLAHLLFYLLQDFRHCTDLKSFDPKVIDAILDFCQLYITDEFYNREWKPGEYEAFKEATFKKFYDHFETLWV